MKRKTNVQTLGLVLLTSILLVGCGNSDTLTTEVDNMTSRGGVDNAQLSSNIPYLKTNHANYSEHGTTQTPIPTKDATAKSISWTIAASTEEGAEKLREHIEFMGQRFQEDKNPRAFDTLFLMEAYMKFNKKYTTHIVKNSTNVTVEKEATTLCAYNVISAHADAVSGDFFARGDTMVDNSSTGEAILASSDCDAVRTELTAYIGQRKMGR